MLDEIGTRSCRSNNKVAATWRRWEELSIQTSVPPVNRELPLRDFGVLRCQCVSSHICLRCAVGAVARLRFSNVSSLAMLRTSGKT